MKSWLVVLLLSVAAPAIGQTSTQVRVAGEVRYELTLRVEDLRQRAAVQERGYGGVRLVDLLREVSRIEVRRVSE